MTLSKAMKLQLIIDFRVGTDSRTMCRMNAAIQTPGDLPLSFRTSRLLALFSVFLFAASFFIPAVDDGGQQTGLTYYRTEPFPSSYWHRRLPGWEVFLAVPKNIPFSLPYLVPWFANVAFVCGYLFFTRGQNVLANKWSLLGVVLVFLGELIRQQARHWLTPLVGYYVWILSMVLLFVAVRWHSKASQRVKRLLVAFATLIAALVGGAVARDAYRQIIFPDATGKEPDVAFDLAIASSIGFATIIVVALCVLWFLKHRTQQSGKETEMVRPTQGIKT